MKLESMDNKKVSLIVLLLSIVVIIGIMVKVKTSYIEVDGSYEISDDGFKKSLRSQLSGDSEILSIVDENAGMSSPIVKFEYEHRKDLKKATTALVVYKTKDKNGSLRVVVLKREDDKWEEVEVISNIGDTYEEIGLEDMDMDGEPEIILGLGASKNNNNLIAIYKKEGKKYVRKVNEKYEKIFIDKFDDNGRKILVTLKRNIDNNQLSLNAFSFLKNGEIKRHSCSVGSIEEKLSVKLSRLNEEKKGFTVQKELESKNSEIMIYEFSNYKFSRIMINGENSIINPIFVEVGDKSNDNIVDIPIFKKAHSSLYEDSGKSPNIIYWSEFDNEYRLKTVVKEYRSGENRFIFTIPNSWGENIDVKEKRDENTDKNTIIFDTYDENEVYKNNIVIGVYSLEEWLRRIPVETNEDNIIFKSENKVYVLEGSSGEPDTDISSVKSNFKVIYNDYSLSD